MRKITKLSLVAVLALASAQPAAGQWYWTEENDRWRDIGVFAELGPDCSAVVAGYRDAKGFYEHAPFIMGLSKEGDHAWGGGAESEGTIHDLTVTQGGSVVVAFDLVEYSSKDGFSLSYYLSGEPRLTGLGLIDEVRIAGGEGDASYVAGSFEGALHLGTDEVQAPEDSSWFLAKAASPTAWSWAREILHSARDIGADDAGNVTIAGADSVYRYSPAGELQWAIANPSDFVFVGESPDGGAVLVGDNLKVVKLDEFGDVAWTAEATVTGEASIRDIDVDDVGRIYLMGYVEGHIRAGQSQVQGEYSTADDINFHYFPTLYTAILSQDGEWLWAFGELNSRMHSAWGGHHPTYAIAGGCSAVYLTGSATDSTAYDMDVYVTRIEFPVGTSAEPHAGVPARFDLGPNYPNPFNPSTTIPFTLTELARVRISLFDVRGREIRVLADRREVPGSHAIRADLSDLPSGTYFYSMEAGGRSDVKAMTLMR